MKNLGTLAKGINIGDMAVSVLATAAANRCCGRGIFHDTTLKGTRVANIVNNYRYTPAYYNLIDTIRETDSKRFFYDNLLSAPNIDGIDIGWGYTTDMNQHTLNRGFVSSADFSKFQTLLRNQNLLHGRQNEEYVNLYNTNGNFLFEKGKIQYNRGDEIVLDYNYSIPHELNTILSLNDFKGRDLTMNNNKWFFSKDKTYGIEGSTSSNLDFYSVPDKLNERKEYKEFTVIGNDGVLNNFNTVNSNTQHYYYNEQDNGVPITEFEGKTFMDGTQAYFVSVDGSSDLLKRTNELFRNGKINSLINRFHTKSTDANNSDLITSYSNKYGISRGRNLLRRNPEDKDNESTYDNPYCRVWTAHHQYSRLKDRIRPFIDETGRFKSIGDIQSNLGDLRPNDGAKRLSDNSVLQNNGLVKISPKYGKITKDDIKKYMFSIENLAWRDSLNSLSTEQKGPHDGRIMWFPPYNLTFSENVNVNWNGNAFIGRGEQIYTYTNTERTGTLDFTILIDHPSSINKWRGLSDLDEITKENSEQQILRYFAGCEELGDDLTPSKKYNKKIEDGKGNINTTTSYTTNSKKIAYVIFFPNDYSGYDLIKERKYKEAIEELKKYEYTTNKDEFTLRDEAYKDEILQTHNLINVNSGKLLNNFSPNSSIIDEIRREIFNSDENIEIKSFNDLLNIDKEFTGNKIFGLDSNTCNISLLTVKGFASSHGKPLNNKDLANNRRDYIKLILGEVSNCLDLESLEINHEHGEIKTVSKDGNRDDVNKIQPKLYRAAVAIFDISFDNDNKAISNSYTNSVASISLDIGTSNPPKNQQNSRNSDMVETITTGDTTYSYDNEHLYFSEISEATNSLVYKHIVDKVKFFDPAYHSITPEGFNSRLTFLHQCTRQGPTVAVNGGGVNNKSNDYLKYAGNLAFGRAPYCILRIGDFFYTKICIESMSISYDKDGVSWDLNPEGAGVQPMFANVSLTFKFLGGQDIGGPIERLQNAVTSNYYANASIYDRHADYGDRRFNPITGKYYN